MKPLIIAHRGASYNAPENTLAAVKLAWQMDADGIEIDVHLTRDGQMVVFHDDNTRRFGGSRKPISQCDYSELLKLDVGRFMGEQFKYERIPLLAEVISTVPENKILVIEVKSGPETVLPLQAIIHESRINLRQVEFISFKRDTIIETKKAFPGCRAMRLYELVQIPLTKIIYPSMDRMINEVKEDKLDGLDISLVPAINQSFINKIMDNCLYLYFWTINDLDQATFLFEAGVDAVATDRPDWLREQYNLVKQNMNL
jgi:glycerophosphoryl diester phosphodiesterase